MDGIKDFLTFFNFWIKKIGENFQKLFLKISGEKFTLRETHSSIQKFPNLFLFFQICQGGPKKKTKNTGSSDGSKQNYVCSYLPK
jgi:hypothetical protein